MAAYKRVLSETGSNPTDHTPKEKRLQPSLSFRSVIVDVMRAKCFEQSFSGALEPLLRKVVSEEVDHAIRRRILALSRSPSMRIKGVEPQETSNLKLVFAKQLSLPIFTGSKIQDSDRNPLQILLVRDHGSHTLRETLPYPLKIELVAIDGDFSTDRGSWTAEEFEAKIIKERAGRRPLLAGELAYSMRDGFLAIGDLEFTDNSSWIRGRKFRVGARVVPTDASNSHGAGVLEAVSEPFVVRDHRGELYKKHYPPVLNDKVWRLEKIGKDGTFHQKLENNRIITVQDFLKLSNVNQNALREILGQGMSDKMWEVTIKHARTCEANNKVYLLRVQDDQLALNPICQVVWANINGAFYNPSQDCNIFTKLRVEELVKVAYENWGSLEEVVGGPTTTAPQLLAPPQIMDQGYAYNWGNEGQMVIQRQYMGRTAQLDIGPTLDEPSELGSQYKTTTNVEMGCVNYNSNASASFENLPS